MSRPVFFRRIAELEFDDSARWYEFQRPGLGSEFKQEVAQALGRISDAPEQFPKIRGNVRRAVLRKFPFSIHFLSDETRITVLAVFQGNRDPARMQNRR